MPPYRMDNYRLISGHGSSESRESFLHNGRDDEGSTDNKYDGGHRLSYRGASFARIWWEKRSLMVVLAISLTTNLVCGVLVFMLLRSVKSQTCVDSELSDFTSYAGLAHDPAVRFPWSTGYGPEITNHTLADERWEALDINAGIVALSGRWAVDHNLPPTQRFPWDSSKGIYTLSAFHTLHCLKNIHRLLYDAHHARPLSRDVGHAMHCVDHIRKDAICNADDFLLPTPPDHYDMQGPRGQARVCRNWDELLGWANEHNACYQHITDDEADFAAHHDELERYKNCPPGSPYLQIMRKQFGSE